MKAWRRELGYLRKVHLSAFLKHCHWARCHARYWKPRHVHLLKWDCKWKLMEKSIRNFCLCDLYSPLVCGHVTHRECKAVVILLVLLVGEKLGHRKEESENQLESAGTFASLHLMQSVLREHWPLLYFRLLFCLPLTLKGKRGKEGTGFSVVSEDRKGSWILTAYIVVVES